ECTLEKDQSARTHLIIELYHVTTELIHRLEKSEFFGVTLTLKLKYSDFTLHTRSKTVAHPLSTLEEILPLAKQLLAELHENGRSVRLIGLTISNQTELSFKVDKKKEHFSNKSDKPLVQFELNFLPW
ncbi:MAG: DNA polymerase IV, partial [Bacteroidaceae bacterium]